MYQPTKVADLKKIGKLRNKNVMILVSWEAETGTYDITTWGSDKMYCKNAAEGGKFFTQKMREKGLIGDESTVHEDENGYLTEHNETL